MKDFRRVRNQKKCLGTRRASLAALVLNYCAGSAHTHNEHADKHKWKGIFDKKNQGDSTFYDQTVIHTQAVYVQKAQFYEVC